MTIQVKLTEMNVGRVQGVVAKEQDKYGGITYTRGEPAYVPTGEPASRKQNCAGYVMKILFPTTMAKANVVTDDFYNLIVKPYGEKVSIDDVGPNDIVVYKNDSGIPNHIAIVALLDQAGFRMRSKDGNERPYVARWPGASVPSRVAATDPLIRAHSDGNRGNVEFWHLDRSRVSIVPQSSGPCD